MVTRESALLELGETLLILQKMERLLAAVLMHMASSTATDRKLEKALLGDKETLGKLLKYFRSRVEMPHDFAAQFDALLRERNIFVHGLFMQPWFDLNTPEGCTRVSEYMKTIRSYAVTTTKVIMVSLTPTEADAAQSPEVQGYIDRVVARLGETAHPDVQASVTDEYIENLRLDILSTFPVGRRDI